MFVLEHWEGGGHINIAERKVGSPQHLGGGWVYRSSCNSPLMIELLPPLRGRPVLDKPPVFVNSQRVHHLKMLCLNI
jgi:hypothetical protein